MESEAQKLSNLRWRRKHRRRNQFYVYRSMTKRFIGAYASVKDLDKVIALSRVQKAALRKNSTSI